MHDVGRMKTHLAQLGPFSRQARPRPTYPNLGVLAAAALVAACGGVVTPGEQIRESGGQGPGVGTPTSGGGGTTLVEALADAGSQTALSPASARDAAADVRPVEAESGTFGTGGWAYSGGGAPIPFEDSSLPANGEAGN